MADDDGFLSRWSRRKQAQKKTASAPAPAETPKEPPPPPAPDKVAAAESATSTVDLASLPPIESLGAESDYTAFLRAGVPQSMQIAALRRLWLTDPSVRNYEALVEYAWDFNAPGYGALLPTDDVQKLLKSVLGEREETTKPSEPAAAPETAPEPVPAAARSDTVRLSTETPAPFKQDTAASGDTAAAPDERADDTGKPRRRHGAALPRAADHTDSG